MSSLHEPGAGEPTEQQILEAAFAPAQPAAQQGVAYAALPEKYYLAGGEVPTWDAKQMRAFADATHALRASHGEAPAGATLYQIMAAAKELHAINRPTGEPEWDALRQCEIDALRRRAERILKVAAPAAPAQPAAAGAAPECLTCSDHGAVGNILTAEPCPDCTRLNTQQAGEAAESGFDYKTAADFLSGKTVSDDALRKFVAASRGAHDARAALHVKMLLLQGELASREAEIALLKRSLLDAEAAAPQPSPTPQADSVQEDAALWHWLAEYLVGTRTDLDDEIVASETVNDLRKLVEAAMNKGATQ